MNVRPVYQQRIAKVREVLARENVDALLLPNFEWGKQENIFYLSGFTGSSAVCVITQNEQIFFTDGRYRAQAQLEVQDWEIEVETGLTLMPEVVERIAGKRVGLIEEDVPWAFARALEMSIENIQIQPLSNFIRKDLRSVKDETEIEAIRHSIQCIEEVLETRIYPLVRPGVTDLDLSNALKTALIARGVESAWDPIILSGAHSAIIHGTPTKLPRKVIEEGDIVQFDVGCILDGYVSDISRVVIAGKKPTEKQLRMHDAVQKAIVGTLPYYEAGLRVSEAAKRANDVLASYGFDEVEKHHSLGHGIGLQVHEFPGINSNLERVFAVGNVVSIEPGIYTEGYGGMRIERDVLITNQGREILDTKLSTCLLSLPAS